MRRRAGRIAWVSAIVLIGHGCATAAPIREGPASPGGQPLLRVGLAVGAADVTIGTGDGLGVVTVAGEAVFALGTGDHVVLAPAGNAVRVVGAGVGPWPRLRVTPRDDAYVTLDGVPYRGTLEIVSQAGGLTVINHVGVEQYLFGVVNREIGLRPDSEHAALEAQAVASRTYALAALGRYEDRGFDVMGSVADQAYGGVQSESEAGRRAVRATRGEVLVYEHDLVAAFFHSTCGPSTAAPQEAFRTVSPRPYLRPVSDRNGEGYFGQMSPHFEWTVEWDGASLLDILRQTVPSTLGVEAATVDVVRDVWVERRGPSGRAMDVRIRVNAGEIPVFAPDVRAVFKMPNGSPLRSNAITFEVEHHDERVSRLIAHGYGWGHGVGLCQWGAIGRARAGQDYRTIVTTYFPGATVERWY